MSPVMTSCPPQPFQKSMLCCPRQTTLSRGIRKRLMPQVNNIQPPLTFPAELPLSFPLCQHFPHSTNPHVNVSHSREPVLTPANAKPSRTLKTNTALFSSCTCWNVKWTWYLGFQLLASLWDRVSRQRGYVWLQHGSGFSEVFIQPSSHHSSENIPQFQRCLLLVWVARTKDGISFVLTGFPRSGLPLTLPCKAYCASGREMQHRSHRSRVTGALNTLPRETTKLPFPKVDRAYGVKQASCWSKQKTSKKTQIQPVPPTKNIQNNPPTITAIGSHSVHLMLHTGHLHLEENKEQMLVDWKTWAFHCFIDLSPQRNLL